MTKKANKNKRRILRETKVIRNVPVKPKNFNKDNMYEKYPNLHGNIKKIIDRITNDGETFNQFFGNFNAPVGPKNWQEIYTGVRLSSRTWYVIKHFFVKYWRSEYEFMNFDITDEL